MPKSVQALTLGALVVALVAAFVAGRAVGDRAGRIAGFRFAQAYNAALVVDQMESVGAWSPADCSVAQALTQSVRVEMGAHACIFRRDPILTYDFATSAFARLLRDPYMPYFFAQSALSVPFRGDYVSTCPKRPLLPRSTSFVYLSDTGPGMLDPCAKAAVRK